MAEEEKEQQEQPKKSKKGMMIAIIIAAQLIVAVLLVVFVIYPRMYPSAPGGEEVKEEQKKEEQGKKLGPTYTISDLTVNPKGSMGRRFAVFEVVLEVNDPTVIDKLNQNKPVIVDQFLTYLRGKTVAELASLDQMKIIRNDLAEIVNRILDEDAVSNLYFTRFVLE
ncbi:MAG TPA: flagellar basal body-associated FliL family protein [Caldithrix abyssi]|uniref:Flagellar protein FliL n=1 Tax=Caldithrix abyssi TaxID=187145 RepID=A0A7V5UFX4_CALAY|nr:flagellar basal body-associated FliL family protein [Caldithrix abyssi]